MVMVLLSFLTALLCASVSFSTSADESPKDLDNFLRVFEPLKSRGKTFYKAANIPAPICPSHEVQYDNIAVKPSRIHPGTFYVPHTHLIADNVRCGKTGDKTEFLWIIPSKNLLNQRSANISNLNDIYSLTVANTRFRTKGFEQIVNRFQSYVGVEMGDRYCGEKLMWKKNSLHIILQADDLILNFGVFGWISKEESAFLSYHPQEKGNSNLCIYKDSTNPGKECTGIANCTKIDESKLLNRSPVPSPDPFPKGPLASPSPDAFSMLVFPSPDSSPVPQLLTDGGDSACFPSSSTVEMESGLIKRMDQLSVGDRIRVGPAEYSTVFLFTHKLSDGIMREFKKIMVKSGAFVSATTGHYIVVNGAIQTAESVKVGDFLTLASGEQSVVTTIKTVWMEGLHNPQTQDGRIIVDGIIASTYTRAVNPIVAHGLLAPLRFLHRHRLLPEWGILNERIYGLSAFAPAGTSVC